MPRNLMFHLVKSKRYRVDKVGLNELSREIPEHRVYKRRWLMLFLWSVTNMMGGFLNQAMSSSTQIFSSYYGVSNVWVEWTSNVWALSNVIFTIPSAWLLKAYGLRWILICSVVLMEVGSVLLLFSKQRGGFYWAFAGITLASVGSGITNSVSARLSNVWFGPSEVSIATCIGLMAPSVGAGFGFLIPSFVFSPHESPNELEKSLGIMNWYNMGINTAILVATILWFEDKPPNAPSTAAQQLDETNQSDDFRNLIKDTQKLFCNTGVLWLLLASAVNAASSNAFTTLLEVIILAYFPDFQKDVGVMGLINNIIGVLALIVSGLYLDKTKRFQEALLWTLVLNGVAGIAFQLFLHLHWMVGVYLAMTAMGWFAGAALGVSTEMMLELTYPVPEGTSIGWMAVLNSLGIVFVTQIVGSCFNTIGAFWCLTIFTVLLLLGAAVAIFVPKTYLRQLANDKGADSAEAKCCERDRF